MYITGTSTEFSSSNTTEMTTYSCYTMELMSKSDTLESINDLDHKSESCVIEASVAETDNEKPPITGTNVDRCIYLENSFLVS